MRVMGYLNGEEVYNKECNKSEVDTCIQESLDSWESSDDIGNIEVEVEDNNGYISHP